MKIKPGLVIEIGEQFLKLVTIGFPPSQPARFKAIVRPVASLNDSQISSLIIDLIKEHKIKSRSVIVSLARNQVTLRNLNLPSRESKEIDQMVELNVARIVPEKKEQTVYSFRIYGWNERGYAKVMVSIAQRDLIKRQLTIIELAGLFTERIVLSSFGALGMIYDKNKNEIKADELYLALEIDTAFTDLMMFSGNELMYSRSIAMEVSQLQDDNAIMKLIGEIRQSLVIFHNEETNQKPIKVFISGSSLNCERIATLIQQELQLAVTKSFIALEGASALPQNVSLSALLEFISDRNTDKAIEFSMPEIEVRKQLRERMKDLITLGIAVLYLFLCVGGIFYGRFYRRLAYYHSLKNKKEKIASVLSSTLMHSRQVDFVKDALLLRRIPLFLLEYLQKNLPKEIAVKFLSIDKDRKIILKGEAQQVSDVFKLVGVLEQAKHFKDIKTGATHKRKIGDKELTSFELNFALSIE